MKVLKMKKIYTACEFKNFPPPVDQKTDGYIKNLL